MPRRFEYNDGNSSKFWEIEQSGNTFTTWWGKIGADAQSKTKTFASEAEAKVEYEKIVAEKARKGYIEVGFSGSAKASSLTNTSSSSTTADPPTPVATRASTSSVKNKLVSMAKSLLPRQAGDNASENSTTSVPQSIENDVKTVLKEVAAEVKEKMGNWAGNSMPSSQAPRYFMFGPEIKLSEFSSVKPLFALSPEHQAFALFLIMQELKKTLPIGASSEYREVLEQTASKLCKRSLPLSESQLVNLIKAAASDHPSKALPGSAVLDQIESFMINNAASEEVKAALKKLKATIQKESATWGGAPDAAGKKLIQRLDVAMQRAAGGGNEAAIPMSPQEAWSDQAIADLKALDASSRQAWLRLLDHCSRTSGTTPSGTWTKKANELISAVGEEHFITHLHRWLSLFPQKGSRTDEEMTAIGHADGALVIQPQNAEILKGLAFCCAGRTDARLSAALGDAAEASFKKVPNLGPRCPKFGNACVHVLSGMNTKESIAQLTRVQARAKHGSVRTQIEKALNNAATKSGMSVDDLQDIGVPDFGMQEIGKLVRDFGNWSAHLIIEDSNTIAVSWVSSNSKTQQTVPAEIKTSSPEQVKELKKIQQDLEKLLPGLRTRLERSYLDQRHWRFTEWCERFLDHPVTGPMARRLLWNFNGRTGIWLEGHFIDQAGLSFTPAPEAIVELWHPIGADVQVVLHWRRWLYEHQIVQPFKQCHREIYVLTDAELQTATYSNRFAAHILKQHQFQHLCAQRGWQYTLMGNFDSHNTPTLNLSRWNLAVEFFVDAASEGNEMGIFTNVCTDKVQFVRCATDAAERDHNTFYRYEPIPLTEIMPVLFSEVMRDVDLFVSVCSIGIDPNWTEGHTDYWRSYAFGDLNVSAEIRKQVLEEIVPRLRIASRCHFEGKFLIVRGDLRTYKIHLGSGNILMDPNDQYLCIVPGRGLTSSPFERVFLPFEGDSMLSLILSKALMLAEDSKIKDQSILSQIKRGT